jgi:hypothetical protein
MRKYAKNLLFPGIIFIAGLVLPQPHAEEDYLVEHIPLAKAYKGGLVRFVAAIPKAGLVRSATIFYLHANTANSTVAKTQVLKSINLQPKDGRFEAVLPVSAHEKNRFLLYYLQVDFQGKKVYFPEKNSPEDFSFQKVNILSDSLVPMVTLLTPQHEAKLLSSQLQLQYTVQDAQSGINFKSLRFYLNGLDYTKLTSVVGNIVHVNLPKDLPLGKYSHQLVVHDYAGNKSADQAFEFELAENVQSDNPIETTEEPWKGKGSISFGYNTTQSNIQKKEDISAVTLEQKSNKNISVQFSATNGDTTIELGPAIISSQPATPGVRPNRFSFGFKKDTLDVKWGDISTQISSLTLNTSMLGASAVYKTDKEARAGTTEFKAAYGQTRRGYEPQPEGLSGVYSRNSVGSYLGYNIAKEFVTYVAFQDTRDLSDSLVDTRNAPVFTNQSAETGATWNIVDWRMKLTTRYALSKTESQGLTNSRQIGYSTGSTLAWFLKPLDLNFGLTFDQTSTNFSVLSGGGAAPDRRSFGLTLSRAFFQGILNVNSKNSTYRNNLKAERAETQYNYNTANTFAISIPKWPSINYSNNLLLVESTGAGDVRTKTFTNNNTLGLSYSYDLLCKQTLNSNGSFVAISDQSSPAQGNNSRSLGLNGGWQAQMFTWLGVLINLSRSENITLQTGDSNISYTYSGALNFSLFSGKMTESLTMNKNLSFSSKDGVTSLQSTAYAYGLNSQINPSENIKFSLSVNYSVSMTGMDVITAFPGNLSIAFQFNMLIKDYG